MATRNIKLGTTTYSGVDTLKVRDADVQDTYIDFKEAGMPMTITSSYTPVAADVGKFATSGSGSNEKMYRVTAMSTETETARTAAHSAPSVSSFSDNTYSIAKLSNSVIAVVGRYLSAGESYEYEFTLDGGTTWYTHYNTTGVDSSVWSNISDIRLLVVNGKIILHCGSYDSAATAFYYSTTGQTFTKVDLSSSGVSDGYKLLGNMDNSLIFGASYGISSVVEYNLTTGTASTHTLPTPTGSEEANYYGIAHGGKFCYTCKIQSMYDMDYILKITTDFASWTDVLITSASGSSSWPSSPIPVYAADASNKYIGMEVPTSEYESTFTIFNVTSGSMYTQLSGTYQDHVIACYMGASTNFITKSSSYNCMLYYWNSVNNQWDMFIGGRDPSTTTYGEFSSGGLQGDTNGFTFFQVAIEGSYPEPGLDYSTLCGIFEHKPYMLKPLSY